MPYSVKECQNTHLVFLPRLASACVYHLCVCPVIKIKESNKITKFIAILHQERQFLWLNKKEKQPPVHY